VAGAASRTVVSPLERLKIIYQVQGPEKAGYKGIGQSLIKMWKEEGWRGYFRGNGVNVIRIGECDVVCREIVDWTFPDVALRSFVRSFYLAPYSAVQFTAYETIKTFMTQGGLKELDTPKRLTAGALAGICSVGESLPSIHSLGPGSYV
jgi:solute carrier family 25 phosphate transporter 23/24/25/41